MHSEGVKYAKYYVPLSLLSSIPIAYFHPQGRTIAINAEEGI